MTCKINTDLIFHPFGFVCLQDAHLSKLISTYLKTHLLSSFKKQLSNYGFQQNANGFASPYFLRDQPEQLVHICRQLRPQEVQVQLLEPV